MQVSGSAILPFGPCSPQSQAPVLHPGPALALSFGMQLLRHAHLLAHALQLTAPHGEGAGDALIRSGKLLHCKLAHSQGPLLATTHDATNKGM